MANPSQSFRLPSASNVKITNIVINDINTEVQHELEDKTNQIIIKHRGIGNIKISFIQNQSSINYFTIPKGCVFVLNDIDFSGKNIFIQSDAIGIIELLETYS